MRRLAIVLLAALALPACATDSVTGAGKPILTQEPREEWTPPVWRGGVARTVESESAGERSARAAVTREAVVEPEPDTSIPVWGADATTGPSIGDPAHDDSPRWVSLAPLLAARSDPGPAVRNGLDDALDGSDAPGSWRSLGDAFGPARPGDAWQERGNWFGITE